MDRKQYSQNDNSTWVFGYGSLIYKVDFPVLERQKAWISGWQRRFWQGSHDHRGTPQSPGRVVTLIAAPGSMCQGVAYRVAPEVFEHLDYREKNGYQRRRVIITLEPAQYACEGVVYVADPTNHAFMGEAPEEELAQVIRTANGPSGSNRDYLLALDEALRDLGEHDPHVQALAALM